jgi:hypothetical protein
VHAVREDPERKGLLFAGTELGLFVSFDDGDRWQPLQNNLPVSSIRDLVIHGEDLVVATHGRSFWILDDIAPLREWAQTIAAQDVHLFRSARAIRIRRSENRDTPLPLETPAGQNPPAGAIFDYFLKSPAATEVTLEIHDHQGNLVRRYSSEAKAPEASEAPEIQKYWLPRFAPLPKSSGIHRFVWDLRYAPPAAMRHEYDMTAIIGSGTVTVPQGPLVLPGEYELALKVAGHTYKSTVTVDMDPRVKIPHEDLAKQFELEQKIDAALTNATDTAQAIAKLREQLKTLRTSLSAKPDAKALLQTVNDLDQRAEKIQGNPQAEWPQTPGGLIGVDGSLGMLAVAAGSADSAPTATSLAAFEENTKQLNDLLTQWQSLLKDLAQLNQKLRD